MWPVFISACEYLFLTGVGWWAQDSHLDSIKLTVDGQAVQVGVYCTVSYILYTEASLCAVYLPIFLRYSNVARAYIYITLYLGTSIYLKERFAYSLFAWPIILLSVDPSRRRLRCHRLPGEAQLQLTRSESLPHLPGLLL